MNLCPVKKTGTLGSVHYDERLVRDFWNELDEFADANSSSFTVHHNSSSTEFYTPEELKNATQIPDRITKFELAIQASEGDLRISANPSGHRYMIRGDEDWVRRMSDYIRDFSSQRENSFRTLLTNKRIGILQFVIFGALVALFWNKVFSLVSPIYSVELNTPQLYSFAGFVASIVLLQLAKFVYPPVEFRRRGSRTRIHKILFVITTVGSVLSVLQSLNLFL
jgi:hypothetical protein